MTNTENLLPALSQAVAERAAGVAPAIVQVFGRKRPASGVVIAPERVLTTSHSVEWEEGVRVRTDDGTVYQADVAGHDHGADVVLLRVPGLPAAPVPPAAGTARVGELVLLTGRSWRGGQHLRLSVVTGLGGPLDTLEGTHLDRIIGLGVGVYPGFSGSAVLAADGSLLALATAGLARGQALAVPFKELEPIVQSLEAHGTPRRGFLGVTTQPVRIPAAQRGTLDQEIGLIVLGVADDSPAARAGVLVGDVLVRAAATRIERPEHLLARLRGAQVGQPLALTLLRGTGLHEATVTVAQRPSRW